MFTVALIIAEPGDDLPTAPDFTARDIHNRLISTDSLRNQGPLIIDFWATWCAPCLAEFKELTKLVEKFKDDKLTVLAINEDGPAEVTKVKQMAALKKWPFIIVMDNGKTIAQKFHVQALPGLFLIGSDGKIRISNRGFIIGDETKLEKEIRDLLDTK